jgi:hypothetical protein
LKFFAQIEAIIESGRGAKVPLAGIIIGIKPGVVFGVGEKNEIDWKGGGGGAFGINGDRENAALVETEVANVNENGAIVDFTTRVEGESCGDEKEKHEVGREGEGEE